MSIPIKRITKQQLIDGLGLKLVPNTLSNGPSASMPANTLGALLRPCVDGERTAQLVKIAGTYIGMGLLIDHVIHLCLAWNATNTPPLPDAKVEATCRGILATHQRNHSIAANDALTPLFDVSEARVDKFLSVVPEPRKWILDQCLPQDIVAMVVAPGGTGKSMFVLQLGIALATGTKLAGYWDVVDRGASLLLFAEEEPPELHRRIYNIIGNLGMLLPPLRDDVEKNLYVKSMTGANNLMTQSGQHGSLTATSYVDRLILTAKQIPNLKLIVIDPASRFRGGNENAAEDATRFVEQLERLRQAVGCTVLLVHHTNKNSSKATEADQNAARGSTALTDGIRWQMNLKAPGAKEAKDSFAGTLDAMRKFLTASVTKNNYGPPQADVLLTRGEHGVLAALNAPAEPDPVVLLVETMRAETAAGRHYSADSFINKFGGKDSIFKLGKVAMRKLLAHALNMHLIVKNPAMRNQLRVWPQARQTDTPLICNQSDEITKK